MILQTSDERNCMKHLLFESSDYFMVRTPLLPISQYFDYISKDSTASIIKELALLPHVKEAIAVSSPTLYKSLNKLDGDINTKKTRNAVSSVMKFLIRMSTRPTPFGLFSGFSSGYFKEKTTGNIGEIRDHKKRARPDMEWLLGIVGLAENSYEIMKDIKVKKNDSAYIIGQRAYLGYHSNGGQLRQAPNYEIKENISISNTEAVQEVLNNTNELIKFKDLVKVIHNKYLNVDIENIRNFVWEIFHEEFLISELRPPFINSDPFKYIIEVLKDSPTSNELVKELDRLSYEIQEYNELPIGEGIEKHEKITKKMKEIYNVQTPLQVDVKLNFKNELNISNHVKQEVAVASDWLWRLSRADIGLTHLRDYHIDFLEKYGTNREVNILELLSDEKGLGAPATYKYPKSMRSFSKDKVVDPYMDRLLFEKYYECIANKSLEIELTNVDLKSLFDNETDEIFAPDSGELFTELLAPSSEDIDKGNFLLSIGNNISSMEIGQTFGRFSDMLEDELKRRIEFDQCDIQKKFSDDSVEFVEASFLPSSGRSGNVSINESTRNLEFTLGTNISQGGCSISPDDIMVGATLGRLYLKSKSLNKRLVFKANNMFNFENAPNIYRFLREVSLEDTKSIQSFNWGTLEHSPFLPRVRSGKVILSPAVWKINNTVRDLTNTSLSFIEWRKLFSVWREKWKVPGIVHLTYGDNRLLVNLDNELHLKEVRSELQKKGRVQLREVISDYYKNHWIKKDSQIYNCELIVPFKKKDTKPPKPKVKLLNSSEVNKKEIYKELGTEWLYFKIYIPYRRQEEFISRELHHFIQNIKDQNLIDKWFYIRYQDPQPHIRLRFKGKPEELIQSVLPKFREWFNESKSNGYVKDFTVNTFEREIERYGGVNLIDTMEKYFEIDSLLAMKLLSLYKVNNLNYDLSLIVSINIIHFLEAIGWDFKKQLNWIKSGTGKFDYIEEIRPVRKELVKLTAPYNNWENLKREMPDLHDLLGSKDNIAKRLSNEISNNIKTNTLTNTPERIIGSLIHMHCNRVLGTSRELEKKSMAHVRHILEGQKYWREKDCEGVYSRRI